MFADCMAEIVPIWPWKISLFIDAIIVIFGKLPWHDWSWTCKNSLSFGNLYSLYLLFYYQGSRSLSIIVTLSVNNINVWPKQWPPFRGTSATTTGTPTSLRSFVTYRHGLVPLHAAHCRRHFHHYHTVLGCDRSKDGSKWSRSTNAIRYMYLQPFLPCGLTLLVSVN